MSADDFGTMNVTLASCSFCGKDGNSFDMVWSPKGKAICGWCVASLASDFEHHELSSKATIHDTECTDFEALRQHWRRSRGRKAGFLSTHVLQRPDGRRLTAYLNEKTRARMIVRAMVPLLPDWIDDEE